LREVYLFLFIVLSGFSIKAQEIYVSSGNNITSYDYVSSNGSDENLEFRSDSGTNFEVGYLHSFNNYKLLYSIGFIYNEFSAEASGAGSNYSWKTRYMGIINKFSYNLSNCCYNTGLNTFLTAGFSTSTLVGGDQFINDNYYDLAKSEDFLGVNIQPFIGINSQYNLARNFKLTLGYNFSKAFHLFNNSEEKISYNTHQIKVGFLVSLYR